LKKSVHIQVFYSPTCPFSFRQLERIHRAIENLKDCIVYEEINVYEKPEDAERMGFYGLLSRDFVPVFIDGQQYAGDFTQAELGEAIKKALKESK